MDYIDFGVQRAVALRKQLLSLKQPSSLFASFITNVTLKYHLIAKDSILLSQSLIFAV